MLSVSLSSQTTTEMKYHNQRKQSKKFTCQCAWNCFVQQLAFINRSGSSASRRHLGEISLPVNADLQALLSDGVKVQRGTEVKCHDEFATATYTVLPRRAAKS